MFNIEVLAKRIFESGEFEIKISEKSIKKYIKKHHGTCFVTKQIEEIAEEVLSLFNDSWSGLC